MTKEQLKASKVAGLNQHVFTKDCKRDPAVKMPKGRSAETQFMWNQLRSWGQENGHDVVDEYKFHPERKWRFDFAIPGLKLAFEYEGIFSAKSRHTTISGYTGDIEKYNAASSLGWRVLRFTAKNYKTILSQLKKFNDGNYSQNRRSILDR